MNKKAFFLFAAIIAALLSACGTAPAVTEFKVDMTEFLFTPSVFTVPAGAEITLTAVNNGAIEHEFVVFKFGATPGDLFNSEDEENIYWEIEVGPGQSSTAVFTAPSEPGEYYVSCGTPGHHEAGMNGKLIVVPAP